MHEAELEHARREGPRAYITMLKRLGSYEEDDVTPLTFKRMRKMTDHPVFSGRMSGRWARYPHWYLELTDDLCLMIRNEDPKKRRGTPNPWMVGVYWIDPRYGRFTLAEEYTWIPSTGVTDYLDYLRVMLYGKSPQDVLRSLEDVLEIPHHKHWALEGVP